MGSWRPLAILRELGGEPTLTEETLPHSGEVGGGTFANGRRCEREAENCCVRQLILTGVVVTALGGYTATSGLVTSGLAQGMKIPGETATQSNIVKPAPLEATDERIAALRIPPGLKLEKFADGLKSPRVIVVGAGGNIYVSSRDQGTISLLQSGMARSIRHERCSQSPTSMEWRSKTEGCST